MPLYTYECSSCKEVFEYKHRMSVVLEDCPLCAGKESLTKVVSEISAKQEFVSRPGDLVKNAIKEAKSQFKSEGAKHRSEKI